MDRMNGPSPTVGLQSLEDFRNLTEAPGSGLQRGDLTLALGIFVRFNGLEGVDKPLSDIGVISGGAGVRAGQRAHQAALRFGFGSGSPSCQPRGITASSLAKVSRVGFQSA
jgi:hypothetical protein